MSITISLRLKFKRYLIYETQKSSKFEPLRGWNKLMFDLLLDK